MTRGVRTSEGRSTGRQAAVLRHHVLTPSVVTSSAFTSSPPSGPSVSLYTQASSRPHVSLVVGLAHADACEPEAFIEANRRRIRRPHLKKDVLHLGGARALEQKIHQTPPDPRPAQVLPNADIQDVRLARAVRHDAVARRLRPPTRRPGTGSRRGCNRGTHLRSRETDTSPARPKRPQARPPASSGETAPNRTGGCDPVPRSRPPVLLQPARMCASPA